MAARTVRTLKERLKDMTVLQRITLALVILLVIAFIVVFFAFEKQIFEQPAVTFVRQSSAGMVVLAAIMAATCIFPLFGYGVVSMICGYVYGVPKGLYRLAFNKYFSRKFHDHIEFKELSKAVSKDGFFILFLIRLSSFPFAVLNAYFGAMTQLSYWRFILATALSTPHLFIPIFIGQNINSLGDPTITGKDRTLKWVFNILGIIIAFGVGWYIYRHTSRRIKRINAGLVAEEDELEDDVEITARAMQREELRRHQSTDLQHQRVEQQPGMHQDFDSDIDLLKQGQWDRYRRDSTFDMAASMEELQRLQRRASGEGRNSEAADYHK
ncbi:Tlg2-vesicle protein [Dissophora globulifera]|uniref:Golgi apparatus membrane protein TVP38 n=1 Tax=Dissophora globulifera TaxID=979702 RepID=A0A9P6UPE7_9FUNG|nr:Tlg2-vesicle protein [Dissophora globulifera]